jgi:hypothetical protein
MDLGTEISESKETFRVSTKHDKTFLDETVIPENVSLHEAALAGTRDGKMRAWLKLLTGT